MNRYVQSKPVKIKQHNTNKFGILITVWASHSKTKTVDNLKGILRVKVVSNVLLHDSSSGDRHI